MFAFHMHRYTRTGKEEEEEDNDTSVKKTKREREERDLFLTRRGTDVIEVLVMISLVCVRKLLVQLSFLSRLTRCTDDDTAEILSSQC